MSAMARSEFWTLFYYGSAETTCSKHRSPAAALRIAAGGKRALNRGGDD